VTLAPRTVIDGGLGSYLESLGHDLSGRLWSARILRDHPDAVVDVHRDYFAAGAAIAITSSYQLSFEGLASVGIDSQEGFALLERSCRLAAQDQPHRVPGPPPVTRPDCP